MRKNKTHHVPNALPYKQDVMPVFIYEGVINSAADIVMAEPTQFVDPFPIFGKFHHTKVLLRCAGRYLSGSGVDGVQSTMRSLARRFFVQYSTEPTMWAHYKEGLFIVLNCCLLSFGVILAGA